MVRDATIRDARTGSYRERLQRVVDYIHDRLDEPLDLNKLAEVACFYNPRDTPPDRLLTEVCVPLR